MPGPHTSLQTRHLAEVLIRRDRGGQSVGNRRIVTRSAGDQDS